MRYSIKIANIPKYERTHTPWVGFGRDVTRSKSSIKCAKEGKVKL